MLNKKNSIWRPGAHEAPEPQHLICQMCKMPVQLGQVCVLQMIAPLTMGMVCMDCFIPFVRNVVNKPNGVEQ